jgi:hypothetical protein
MMSGVFIGLLRVVGFLFLKLINAWPLAVAMWETAEHERSLPRAVEGVKQLDPFHAFHSPVISIAEF